MVLRKDLKKKYALISVFDKSFLKELCECLDYFDYNFISTGKTGKAIESFGYKCIDVSEITEFKEILGGRVKTLHPKIYGSILFRRNKKKDNEEFYNLKSPKIDIVIINLYPFEYFSKKNNELETIEMIDIGGPSLLRASAKNYKFMTTIGGHEDYRKLSKYCFSKE